MEEVSFECIIGHSFKFQISRFGNQKVIDLLRRESVRKWLGNSNRWCITGVRNKVTITLGHYQHSSKKSYVHVHCLCNYCDVWLDRGLSRLGMYFSLLNFTSILDRCERFILSVWFDFKTDEFVLVRARTPEAWVRYGYGFPGLRHCLGYNMWMSIGRLSKYLLRRPLPQYPPEHQPPLPYRLFWLLLRRLNHQENSTSFVLLWLRLVFRIHGGFLGTEIRIVINVMQQTTTIALNKN